MNKIFLACFNSDLNSCEPFAAFSSREKAEEWIRAQLATSGEWEIEEMEIDAP